MTEVSVDLQGIEPFLSQYPSELDDLALEFRFIHPWETNPKTGKNRTIPIFRRIGDIKADPQAIKSLVDIQATKSIMVCAVCGKPWGDRHSGC